MYRRAYWPNEGTKGSPTTYSPTPEEYKKAIEPDHVDRCGRSALHQAIVQNGDDEQLLKRVLKAGCDVNAADKDGHHGVHFAAERGFTRCLQVLVKNGAELDVLNNCGYSPLMLAARHGFPKAVRILIRGGLNINLDNDKNEQALHYAVCKGHLECVQELVANKANVNHANAEGTTPLMYAVRFGHTDIMKCLLTARINVDKKDSVGRSALHWAASMGTAQDTRALLEANADIDLFDNYGQSPFLNAIQMNNHRVLQVLLEAGCDSSTVDGLNGTGLGLASLKGHNECVRLLLEKDDDPDEVGFFGLTPLMAAAFESQVEIVKTLLEYGADPNISGRLGATPLIKCIVCVCEKNQVARHKIATMLIQAGADVNATISAAGFYTPITNGKNCPLSFAMCGGYVSIMVMLLTAGCKVTCDELRQWNSESNFDRFFDRCSLRQAICQFMYRPRTLMHFCRVTIRKNLQARGINISRAIAKLPIAPILKEYVAFKDLEQIEPTRAKVSSNPYRELHNIVPPGQFHCPSSLRMVEGTFLQQTVMSGQI